jgi:tocopherol O-methyltransferase
VDWLQNDLSDGSYDAVYSIECISHVADKPAFFDEMARVLKPGGRGVVVAWLRPPRQPALARRWIEDPVCRGGSFSGLETLGNYREMASRSGLRVVEASDWTRSVRRTWPHIYARCLSVMVADHRLRSLAFRGWRRNLRFARTALLSGVGFYSGALRYGAVVVEKPSG